MHGLWCSIDRYQSLGFSKLLFYEIDQKLTELWPENVCPYMGACRKNSSFWPITWPNINIFELN